MPGRATLQEPYASALDEAVDYLRERYEPVAVVASGSVVRGTGHTGSDLDIVVIHEPPWRQRIQHVINGVPWEAFVNPEFQIRRQMEKDARAGRPVMAHMLDTGIIVLDTDGIAGKLVADAHTCLAAGPQVDPASLNFRRYGIATQFEDAVDLAVVDGDRSRTLLIEALVAGMKWWSLANGRWLPRDKDLFADLDRREPDLGMRI
ncbi:MAG TPA: nucleotidyltransferase domain-containing protein, partial [Thermomicrobiales bacterium]|nr:nucleotidyltransferase domain-containing protein [Thermomicrobiales bacterium]